MRLLLIILISSWLGTGFSQITLNEASNANGSNYILANGTSPDWIELYNGSATNASLQGLFLSDDRSILQKWQFPPITLGGFQFTTVLATGNGSSYLVNHFETAVGDDVLWDYTVPGTNIPNWNLPTFSTAGWLQGKMSIGYGDGDDSTVIPSPTTTVYARIPFTVSNVNDIVKAILDIDYDDGFVAYLNGIEIARVGLSGTPPTFDELAQDHEALLYQGGAISSLDLDMSVVAGALTNGTNVLAIEIHNASSTSSDLTCRPFLTFGLGTATQQFGEAYTPISITALADNLKPTSEFQRAEKPCTSAMPMELLILLWYRISKRICR